MAFIQKLSQFRTPVSTYTNLPISGNIKGDIRIATDTGSIYVWNSDAGNDSYTKLLLHLDNNVTDSESTPKTVTNNNVTFSTTNKFGGYSASFNGSSSYLSVPDSTDLNFSTGDFTIDFWMYSSSLTTDLTSRLVSKGILDSDNWNIKIEYISGNTYQIFWQRYISSVVQQCYGNVTLLNNTWYHIAIVRNANNFSIYVNGNLIGSITNSESSGNFSSPLEIGRWNKSSGAIGYFNGIIDEFRISKGIARWTSAFTPPSSAYTVGSLSDWKKVTSSSYNDLSGSPYSSGLAIDTAVNIVTDLSVNIAILAWQTLTNFGASIVKMFDGVLNQFVDQGDGTSAGLQLDHCSNEVLNVDENQMTYFYEPVASTNMTLQSVGYVTNDVPTSARIVILEQDVDVITENTDLLVYLSRDGGTTFTAVTITKDSSYGDGTLNIFTGSCDLSLQPNASLMVWKLVTQNHKDCKIRGIALNWKS